MKRKLTPFSQNETHHHISSSINNSRQHDTENQQLHQNERIMGGISDRSTGRNLEGVGVVRNASPSMLRSASQRPHSRNHHRHIASVSPTLRSGSSSRTKLSFLNRDNFSVSASPRNSSRRNSFNGSLHHASTTANGPCFINIYDDHFRKLVLKCASMNVWNFYQVLEKEYADSAHRHQRGGGDDHSTCHQNPKHQDEWNALELANVLRDWKILDYLDSQEFQRIVASQERKRMERRQKENLFSGTASNDEKHTAMQQQHQRDASSTPSKLRVNIPSPGHHQQNSHTATPLQSVPQQSLQRRSSTLQILSSIDNGEWHHQSSDTLNNEEVQIEPEDVCVHQQSNSSNYRNLLNQVKILPKKQLDSFCSELAQITNKNNYSPIVQQRKQQTYKHLQTSPPSKQYSYHDEYHYHDATTYHEQRDDLEQQREQALAELRRQLQTEADISLRRVILHNFQQSQKHLEERLSRLLPVGIRLVPISERMSDLVPSHSDHHQQSVNDNLSLTSRLRDMKEQSGIAPPSSIPRPSSHQGFRLNLSNLQGDGKAHESPKRSHSSASHHRRHRRRQSQPHYKLSRSLREPAPGAQNLKSEDVLNVRMAPISPRDGATSPQRSRLHGYHTARSRRHHSVGGSGRDSKKPRSNFSSSARGSGQGRLNIHLPNLSVPSARPPKAPHTARS